MESYPGSTRTKSTRQYSDLNECRCMRDECASCMERYRLGALDLERALRPGGRLRLKLSRIRELACEIEKRRGRA